MSFREPIYKAATISKNIMSRHFQPTTLRLYVLLKDFGSIPKVQLHIKNLHRELPQSTIRIKGDAI